MKNLLSQSKQKIYYILNFFCFFYVPLFAMEHIYLKAPVFSEKEKIGTNVGIRPYRKSGIRLEPESFQNKLVIHNYGYGGSGLTLAFGGAKKTLEILDHEKLSCKEVAVLGAGVVGLATAYDLLEKGYQVHLYSDGWIPDLTSNVAAGCWTPLSFPSDLSEEKQKLHKQLLEISENRFLKSIGNDPEFAGVKKMCYYRIKLDIPENGAIPPKESEEVILHFDEEFAKKGYRDYRLGIDGKLFMEDLYSKVKNKGAILHQKHFEKLEEVLNLKESIIINCMSIGSRELFNDQEFIPVRGQLVYFNPQEGIDYVLSQSIPDSPYFILIYPWQDRLILGGVYEIGEEIPVTTPEVIGKMIQHAQDCLKR